MPQRQKKERILSIGNHELYLAQPTELPKNIKFTGRENELQMCRIAWGLDKTYQFQDEQPPNTPAFRLYGPPGMGKNEIVYELVRQIRANNPTLKNLPFYSMVGHDEMSPEDMVLAVVPAESQENKGVRMVLRASPLATAILEGGIFFFDELNRLPERALAPLAPALDNRGMLFSSTSGIWLKPSENAKPFLFCCALNPNIGKDLPGYIDQRTIPKIEVTYPDHESLIELIKNQITSEIQENKNSENDLKSKKDKPGNKKTRQQSNDEIGFLEKQTKLLESKLEKYNLKPSVRQGLMIIRLMKAILQQKGTKLNGKKIDTAVLENSLYVSFKKVFPDDVTQHIKELENLE